MQLYNYLHKIKYCIKCRYSDGRKEYVDFELKELSDGTKLSSYQLLEDGDLLQLSIFLRANVSILKHFVELNLLCGLNKTMKF